MTTEVLPSSMQNTIFLTHSVGPTEYPYGKKCLFINDKYQFQMDYRFECESKMIKLRGYTTGGYLYDPEEAKIS